MKFYTLVMCLCNFYCINVHFLLYIYPFLTFESMRKCHFFTFVGFYMQ